MNAYSAFLFDFDFTLVNALPGIVKSYNTAFQTYGLPAMDDLTVKKTVGLPVPTSFMLMNPKVDESLAIELDKVFTKAADRYMGPNTSFLPGVRDFLLALQEKGCALGVVTTKKGYRIHDFFRQEGLSDLLSLVIGGDEVANMKPHPEGILTACDFLLHRHGIPKEKVLYVGDSLVDAEAAARAGIDFAAVLTGTTEKEEFSAFPSRLIEPTMSDLRRRLFPVASESECSR